MGRQPSTAVPSAVALENMLVRLKGALYENWGSVQTQAPRVHRTSAGSEGVLGDLERRMIA